MSFIQEVCMLEAFGDVVAQMGVAGLGALGSAVWAGFKSIKFVHEGELGVRLRFGKAMRDRQGIPKVIKPGFVLLIPWVDSLQRRHVRQQTIRLEDQTIMIKDDLIFTVSAMVMFRVTDVYRALFEISGLTKSLEDLSMAILREVLVSKNLADLADMNQMSEELLAALVEKGQEWGVEFLQFRLTNLAPTSETASLVTVKQGVKMRVEALASVRSRFASGDLGKIPASLASALVGIPVVTSLGESQQITVTAPSQE